MKISRFIVFILAAASLSSSWALMPPKYLSVLNWKKCVATETRGSAQFVCLPLKKPRFCSNSSWQALTQGQLVPLCHKK